MTSEVQALQGEVQRLTGLVVHLTEQGMNVQRQMANALNQQQSVIDQLAAENTRLQLENKAQAEAEGQLTQDLAQARAIIADGKATTGGRAAKAVKARGG